MKLQLNLTPHQWKTLASALSNIGQAIILFSFAAYFVPKTINLPNDFSKEFPILTFIDGVFILAVAVIISKKEK